MRFRMSIHRDLFKPFAMDFYSILPLLDVINDHVQPPGSQIIDIADLNRCIAHWLHSQWPDVCHQRVAGVRVDFWKRWPMPLRCIGLIQASRFAAGLDTVLL
jgi:hypothetical protein